MKPPDLPPDRITPPARYWSARTWLRAGILLAGYVLLICFAVRNAGLTGMVLVAVGLLANLAVIAVDGGMPVRGLENESL